MTFKELNIEPAILDVLKIERYHTPTPIQEEAIPAVLGGRDLLATSQTGTGKTAAFAIPTLQLLNDAEAPERNRGARRPIRSLILTPTRELALQIYENYRSYGRNLDLRTAVIYGGVTQKPQERILARGIDILIATPGRLVDLIGQKLVDLRKVEILTLDEADRMLDMGFIHDVKKILGFTPKKKQTLLFSATMPKEVSSLAASLLTDPFRISIKPEETTVEAIEQSLYYVERSDKRRLLIELLETMDVGSGLVFTRTKHGADRVVKELLRNGIPSAAIHGNKSQGARVKALGAFKDGSIRILVATDIAARGIDIDDLTHVINFDLPSVPETYVHRIGRTGRAGRAGIAFSFCDETELKQLRDIERFIKIKIPVDAEYSTVPAEQAKPAQQSRGGQQQRGPQQSRGAQQARRTQQPRAARR